MRKKMLHAILHDMEDKVKKILIVENERVLAEMMGFTITRHGFEIRTVYGGQEALDILAKEKFDLVLLDILMPEKGGLEVLEEMRAWGNKVPVIIFSNLNDEATIKRATELGIKDFLVKADTTILDLIERIKAGIAS